MKIIILLYMIAAICVDIVVLIILKTWRLFKRVIDCIKGVFRAINILKRFEGGVED